MRSEGEIAGAKVRGVRVYFCDRLADAVPFGARSWVHSQVEYDVGSVATCDEERRARHSLRRGTKSLRVYVGHRAAHFAARCGGHFLVRMGASSAVPSDAMRHADNVLRSEAKSLAAYAAPEEALAEAWCNERSAVRYEAERFPACGFLCAAYSVVHCAGQAEER